MEGFSFSPESESESESWVRSISSIQQEYPANEPIEKHPTTTEEEEEEKQEERGILRRSKSLGMNNNNNKKTKKNLVLLEGYVEAADEDLARTKSLTDEDLDELKGCLDLGFGFSYDEIPELCNTLPALELCYSMSQKFMDRSPESSPSPDSLSSSIANWRISSPGDHPEDVKARLKFWAQAVACTVKLCN